MSYHYGSGQSPEAPKMQLYPLPAQPRPMLPLSAVQPAPPVVSRRILLILAAIVIVVLLVMLLLWWLQREEKTALKRNGRTRVRKQSTAQMSKNLYGRLQQRGGVDSTTMRSLAQLSRNA